MAVVNKIQGQKCRCGSHQCIKRSEVKSLSRVRLFATLWTVAYQAPPSVGFSRQEYWSGLPFPSPGDLPNPGIEPRSPALPTDALPSEPPGNPPAKAGDIRDTGSILGSGRAPGGGHSNPLQYSCLENPMDRGTRWATAHWVVKSRT